MAEPDSPRYVADFMSSTEGLQLMNRGAKYRFWIPPELAYGSQVPPGGPIPPDALLVFDVTLRDFQPLPPGAGGLFGGR